MTKIDGILTIRSGVARIWNRPSRVSQAEMRRLVAVLQAVPGLDAYALPPDAALFSGPIASRPLSHADHMSRHPSRPRTYSVVSEPQALV